MGKLHKETRKRVSRDSMTEIAYRCNLKQRVSQGHYKCDNKDRQQRKGQVRDHPQNRERRAGLANSLNMN